MIYDLLSPLPKEPAMIDPFDPSRGKRFSSDVKYRDLLVPILRGGKSVYQHPSLYEMRNNTIRNLEEFQPGVRRFLYPQAYDTGLEESL